MKPGKKKRVYVEDVKTRHTTHWDLDYLSLVELDAMYGESRGQGPGRDQSVNRPPRRTILTAVLAGAAAVLLAAVALLVLRF